jgi:nucleoside-diphosphate-sugar epimerase
MEKAKVLVAGATGYLGKCVIGALHREGYRIRALVRIAERLGEMKALCDEIVVPVFARFFSLKTAGTPFQRLDSGIRFGDPVAIGRCFLPVNPMDWI